MQFRETSQADGRLLTHVPFAFYMSRDCLNFQVLLPIIVRPQNCHMSLSDFEYVCHFVSIFLNFFVFSDHDVLGIIL